MSILLVLPRVLMVSVSPCSAFLLAKPILAKHLHFTKVSEGFWGSVFFWPSLFGLVLEPSAPAMLYGTRIRPDAALEIVLVGVTETTRTQKKRRAL